MDETHKSILMNRDRGECCTVNLFGGNVTSWKVNNTELIYTSAITNYDNHTPFRGGCCLSFPYYGIWALGPNHGFARNSHWKVEEYPKKQQNATVTLKISMCNNPYTESIWCYKFRILETITLGKNSLTVDFEITNTDLLPFYINPIIHSYIKIDDIRNITVKNLQGCQFLDDFNDKRDYTRFTEENEVVKFNDYFDRVYIDAPREVIVTDVKPRRHIRAISNNFKNYVFWNPWTKKKLSYSEDDDYMRFIGVEVGNITDKTKIMPNEKMCFGYTFEYMNDDEVLEAEKDFFNKHDLFELCSKQYEMSNSVFNYC